MCAAGGGAAGATVVEDKDALDRLVNAFGDFLIRLGFNGTRLKWKWHNWRSARAEAALADSMRFRAVTAKHKMCPQCRSLVPARSLSCPECHAAIAHVRGPGLGRLFEWLIPGVAPVTAVLVTSILLVYGVMLATQGASAPASGGLFGMLGFDTRTLARFGLGYGPWVAAGEYWRLFTPLFLHGGVIHVLFNAYALLQIGPLIEEEFGAARMWSLYLIAGLCGGLTSHIVRPILSGGHVPYVGASGAIFGLVGAAFVFGWRRGGVYGAQLRRLAVQWTVYALIYGFVLRGIDNYAHMGGLLGGAAMAFLMTLPGERNVLGAVAWRIAGWAGVAAVAWAFVMAGLFGADALNRV